MGINRKTYPDYLGRERSTGDYTLVVADMMDDPATDATRINNGFIDTDTTADGVKFDAVGRYTIRQLEDAVRNQKSWIGWRINIKNRYPNRSENELPQLFEAYQ